MPPKKVAYKPTARKDDKDRKIYTKDGKDYVRRKKTDGTFKMSPVTKKKATATKKKTVKKMKGGFTDTNKQMYKLTIEQARPIITKLNFQTDRDTIQEREYNTNFDTYSISHLMKVSDKEYLQNIVHHQPGIYFDKLNNRIANTFIADHLFSKYDFYVNPYPLPSNWTLSVTTPEEKKIIQRLPTFYTHVTRIKKQA